MDTYTLATGLAALSLGAVGLVCFIRDRLQNAWVWLAAGAKPSAPCGTVVAMLVIDRAAPWSTSAVPATTTTRRKSAPPTTSGRPTPVQQGWKRSTEATSDTS
jgi:hypothetical protein